jgi:hypothetical protein
MRLQTLRGSWSIGYQKLLSCLDKESVVEVKSPSLRLIVCCHHLVSSYASGVSAL